MVLAAYISRCSDNWNPLPNYMVVSDLMFPFLMSLAFWGLFDATTDNSTYKFPTLYLQSLVSN